MTLQIRASSDSKSFYYLQYKQINSFIQWRIIIRTLPLHVQMDKTVLMQILLGSIETPICGYFSSMYILLFLSYCFFFRLH